MTETICEILGLDEDEKEIYHIAAHLHDIGKIGIRDDVLLKEGKLDDEEWEIMKSHSEQGQKILVAMSEYPVSGIMDAMTPWGRGYGLIFLYRNSRKTSVTIDNERERHSQNST